MRIYVSIPISGRSIEEAKLHATAIARQLTAFGHEVVTPFDVCPDRNKPYAYCMGRDIEVLLECDALAIGNEWFNCRGCLLEKAAAEIYGIKIVYESCFHFLDFDTLEYDLQFNFNAK